MAIVISIIVIMMAAVYVGREIVARPSRKVVRTDRNSDIDDGVTAPRHGAES